MSKHPKPTPRNTRPDDLMPMSGPVPGGFDMVFTENTAECKHGRGECDRCGTSELALYDVAQRGQHSSYTQSTIAVFCNTIQKN